MKRIVIMGHGGYAEGVRQNVEMIAGTSANMYYIDLTNEDGLKTFEKKVKDLLETFGEDEVLFVCDLLGASPFRTAAMLCAENPGRYCAVTGINPGAIIELSMSTEEDITVSELAEKAIETTKSSAVKFPE